jgi:tetratricopeptide (TPR) repeat protein
MQRNSTFLSAAATALLALLLCGAAAQGQAWRGPGRAKGVILDPSGNPVVGATVHVSWAESEGGGPPPLKTDAKGRWSLVGLVPGDWKLKVEAVGYHPFEEGFVVYGGGAPDTLRATLDPIPKEVLEAERQAEQLKAINSSLKEGNELSTAGKYPEARVAYEKALTQVEPGKKADILVGIASTYVQEQKPEEGVKYLEQALADDPKNEGALRLMVAVLASQGKDEEAKKYLAQLPDEQSLDASTQVNLGIMKYNEGKLDEASAIFERVLTQSPDRAEVYYFAGLVHLNQQKNDVALERFKKFLELAPQHEKAAEAREFVKHLEQSTAKP